MAQDTDHEMVSGNEVIDPAQERRAKRQVIALLATITIGVISAAFFIFQLAQSAALREIAQWHIYLDTLAENRQQSIENWVEEERTALNALAENTAVRLYLTELGLDPNSASAQAQETYLRNLITVNAERWGLNQSATKDVKANIEADVYQGLSLSGAGLKPIASLGRVPELANLDPATLSAKGVVIGPLDMGNGQLVIQILMPIYAIQAEPGADALIGVLQSVRPFITSFAPLLRQPGTRTSSLVTALVKDGDTALTVVQSSPEGGLVDAFLPKISGQRPFLKLDQSNGHALLGVMKPIRALGLELMVAIPEKDVSEPVDTRRNVLIGGLGLMLFLGVVAILLLWRHGVSLRLARARAREHQINIKLKQARNLLRHVADKQRTAILVLNSRNKLLFANQAVVKISGAQSKNPDKLLDKSVEAILGAAVAKPFTHLAHEVRETRDIARSPARIDYGQGARQGHIDAVPMSGPDLEDGAVLLVWDDLTELIDAKEKREKSLEQLLEVLIGLIDARDPYSAAQSRRVAQFAAHVGQALDLSPEDLRVTQISGLIMNLGKVLVPSHILTRPGRLNDDEIALVHNAIARTSDLLRGVDFDAPVIPVLEEALGKEQNIQKPAALLRVINAFIGMVSPRAHREALDVGTALNTLRAQILLYDPAIISALAHVLDNKGGRSDVQDWHQDQPVTDLPPGL